MLRSFDNLQVLIIESLSDDVIFFGLFEHIFQAASPSDLKGLKKAVLRLVSVNNGLPFAEGILHFPLDRHCITSRYQWTVALPR